MAMMTCDIYILNYNGRHLLEDSLPSIVEAVDARGKVDDIKVIDNASQDDSVEFLRRSFPQVKIVQKEKNNFLFSVNEDVRSSTKDYFIFLNNDLKVDKGFIAPLLDCLGNSDVFAATCKIYDWEGKSIQSGKRYISFKKFTYNSWYDFDRQYPCHTLFASGGASAYNRKTFVELGGFDELFNPGYLEDVDLSYRAWKAGYKVIYCPSSIVYHKGRQSFGKFFNNSQIDRIFLRNSLFFMWKNISDIYLLLPHLMLLPYRLLRVVYTGPSAFGYEYLKTILRCPGILMSARKARKQFRITDKEAFRLINMMDEVVIREGSSLC